MKLYVHTKIHEYALKATHPLFILFLSTRLRKYLESNMLLFEEEVCDRSREAAWQSFEVIDVMLHEYLI